MGKTAKAGLGELFSRHSFFRAFGLGLVLAVFAGGGFAARGLAKRRAEDSFRNHYYARSAHLLRPWFVAGLLDAEGARLLMDSLLSSSTDPSLALEAAETCLEKLQQAECALGAALAYERLNRPDRAESALLQVLAQAPQFAAAHLQLGELAEKEGKIALAAAEFGAVISYEKGPKKQVALLKLVKLLNKEKRYKEAEQYLDDLRTLSESDSIEGLYAAAEGQLGLGKEQEFMKTMRIAERLRDQSKVSTFFVLNNESLYRAFNEIARKDPGKAQGAEAPRLERSPR